MNAVRPGKGIQVLEHEMEFVQQIRGVEVKDLVTKYFYRENQLCFQIILHLEGGETLLFKEFSGYGKYKAAMDELLAAQADGSIIKIPKGRPLDAPPSSKVA